MSKIGVNDKAEFVGQMIDIFEDWLTEKGITVDDIPNDEREDDDSAIIYGSDYGYLQSQIEKLMIEWNVMEGDR